VAWRAAGLAALTRPEISARVSDAKAPLCREAEPHGHFVGERDFLPFHTTDDQRPKEALV
jgi:hypothetical protein